MFGILWDRGDYMQQEKKEEKNSKITEILNKRSRATSNDEVYDEWKRFIRNRK